MDIYVMDTYELQVCIQKGGGTDSLVLGVSVKKQ